MTTSRFDIEIQDKVAKSIRQEILGIASASRDAFSDIKRLKGELSGLNASGINRAASASASAATASGNHARESDKAAAAMAREAQAADRLAASYAAQARAARSQAGFNNQLGVGRGVGRSAEDSASAFASQAPTAAMVAAEKAADKYEKTLGRVGNTTRLSSQHAMNLGFQLNDIGVSLLSGQKPLTVFVQQGAQIGQIASQSGVGLMGMARGAWALVAPFAPLVLTVGAAAAAFAVLNKNINDDADMKKYAAGLGLTKKEMKELEGVTVTWGDTAMAAFEVVGGAIWGLIGAPFEAVGTTIKEVWDAAWGVVKDRINGMIGMTVGAVNFILNNWRRFPAAIGDIFFSGVNLAIKAINGLISASVNGVNGFIDTANGILSKAGMELPRLEAPQIAELANEYKGAAAEVGGAFASEMASAMSFDYLGAAYDAVRDEAVRNAQERLRKQAQEMIEDRGAGRQGGKTAAEKRADEMDKLNRELDAQILLLGFYGTALDRESKFQTINNALLDKKIQLTTDEERSIRARILLIQDGVRVQDALNKIEEETAGSRRAYEATLSAINIALRDNIISETEASRRRNLANTELAYANDPFKAYNDNLREGTELAALYGRELSIQTRAQELFNAAVAAGKADASGSRADFVGTARDEQSRQEMSTVFADIDPRERQDTNSYLLDNANQLYAEIERLRQADLISETEAQERKKNLDRATLDARLSTTGEILGQISSLQQSKNKELAALGKAAAIAQATIDGYRAVQAALVGPPGPPWSFAIAGVTGAMAAANVAKIAGVGFMAGGYTGNMPANQVAGSVHGREYVFDAAATQRIGVPALDAMRAGSRLGAPANDNGGNGGPRVVIKPMPGVFVEEVKTSTGEIELIARRITRDEAPKAVAADVKRNPNSVTSKAVGQSFGLKRADR